MRARTKTCLYTLVSLTSPGRVLRCRFEKNDEIMSTSESTPVRVTIDTNVLYYLGAGTLSKRDVVVSGQELWVTPINVLEILAGISAKEWNARRDAAKAIIIHADNMAADPEEHLSSVIERRPPRVNPIWRDGAEALSQATSEADLLKGVADFSARVIRSVNPKVAAAAKATHYDGFIADMITLCDRELPGYRASVDGKTHTPVVKKEDRDKVRSDLSSVGFVVSMFCSGLLQRYRLIGTKQIDLLSNDTFLALQDLAPYCAVYGGYLRELLTARRKPDSNDWGDLELFLYLQPGTFVATAEQKWGAIADLVGLGSRVKKIRPRSPATGA